MFISIDIMMTCFKLVWMWGSPLCKPGVQQHRSIRAFCNCCMHCVFVNQLLKFWQMK